MVNPPVISSITTPLHTAALNTSHESAQQSPQQLPPILPNCSYTYRSLLFGTQESVQDVSAFSGNIKTSIQSTPCEVFILIKYLF